MSEELLSTKEVAQHLGVHEKQVYALIKAKRIPATRLTGKWIFPRKLLDQWLEDDARRSLGKARERGRKLDGAILGAGSDDPALALLAGELHRSKPDGVLFVSAIGSTEGIKALDRGDVDLCFSHLFDPDEGEYNLPFLKRLVPNRKVVAVNLFRREVGFVVEPGNPKRVRSFKDLGKRGVRMVNRQPGSGTRLLLEQELAAAGVSRKSISGWDREANTHYEVALTVKSGEADVGVASGAVARLVGLDFVPLREERFDMLLDQSLYFEQRFQALLERIASASFRERAGRMGGYVFRDCGTVLAGEA